MTATVIPSGSRTHDEHFVRFYQDDSHLYNSVGRFLREGLECGEGIVVIATLFTGRVGLLTVNTPRASSGSCARTASKSRAPRNAAT